MKLKEKEVEDLRRTVSRLTKAKGQKILK